MGKKYFKKELDQKGDNQVLREELWPWVMYKPQSNLEEKNHTHVKKWGTSQNFFLAFIDELEKQTIIERIAEVGQ